MKPLTKPHSRASLGIKTIVLPVNASLKKVLMEPKPRASLRLQIGFKPQSMSINRQLVPGLIMAGHTFAHTRKPGILPAGFSFNGSR